MKSSLRTKMITSILLITIFSLGGFQLYSYMTAKGQFLHELESVADEKIGRLSRDLNIPLWELDQNWIKKTMLNELIDERVCTIALSGEGIVPITVTSIKADEKHAHFDDIIRTAAIVHDGEKIGEIKIHISKEVMYQRLNARALLAVELGLIQIIVVSLFLWIMIDRLILIPVKSLMESTRRIAHGDYTYESVRFEEYELGSLAASIDEMKQNIEVRERELKENNIELAALKERLEYAISGTQDGLWDWNIKTNEVYFSPRWKEMMGYHDDELPNVLETWENNVHPDDLEKTLEAVTFSQEIPGRFYENVHRIRHKSGNWLWILDRGQTVFDDEGKPIRMVGFHTDITKQKHLEQELLEKEELMIAQSRHVAMGEMIGMIAHQWRQPITVIAMGANNMLADIALEEVKIENFMLESQQILQQTEYLSKTIDDFRTFFRPNKEKDEVKVIDIFLEAKQIMGKSLENHNVELVLSDHGNETILTYSRELLQVILNLLKNAKEVLDSNKTNNPYINVNIQSLTDNITITLCDNGGGINENLLERIFEPYFSTKDTKSGTGLGLYMSKIIIEKHLHGTICASNDDKGACFTIVLPRIFNEGSQNE